MSHLQKQQPRGSGAGAPSRDSSFFFTKQQQQVDDQNERKEGAASSAAHTRRRRLLPYAEWVSRNFQEGHPLPGSQRWTSELARARSMATQFCILSTRTRAEAHVSYCCESKRDEPTEAHTSLALCVFIPSLVLSLARSPLDKKTFEDILLSATIHACSLKGLLLIISASEDAFLSPRNEMRGSVGCV